MVPLSLQLQNIHDFIFDCIQPIIFFKIYVSNYLKKQQPFYPLFLFLFILNIQKNEKRKNLLIDR